MADFKIAHKRTSLNEGGYTDNPEDNGNWTGGKKGVGYLIGTNKGISAPVLASYLKRTPTVNDMRSLSDKDAEAIYKKNYWDQIRGDDWSSQEKANHVYDMAVNAGVGAAIKLWQMALGLTATGKMNSTTLNRTNLI